MTSAEQFATWLKQAMRRAGYDIDAQRGGGRQALAEKMNISKSTVTRWLSGDVLPAAEYFEPLAEALDVKVVDLLIGAGIVALRDLSASKRPTTPEEAAAELGITDPADVAAFVAIAERLSSRSHVQRGVGGPPRPRSLNADEPGE